jgi:hypothetical protein
VNLIPLRLLPAAAALAALSACAAAPLEASPRTPVRWIMVEKPVGDVVPSGQNGDGQVDPRSVIVTLQPLYAEDLNWEVTVDPHDYFVEILEITPKAQAAPGETVIARVRVGHARPGELYRLTARASRTGVEILGGKECIVRGGAPAAFRFTSLEPGRAGITVGVERLEPRGP